MGPIRGRASQEKGLREFGQPASPLIRMGGDLLGMGPAFGRDLYQLASLTPNWWGGSILGGVNWGEGTLALAGWPGSQSGLGRLIVEGVGQARGHRQLRGLIGALIRPVCLPSACHSDRSFWLF